MVGLGSLSECWDEREDRECTCNTTVRVAIVAVRSCAPLSTTLKHYVYGYFTYTAGNNNTYLAFKWNVRHVVRCSTNCIFSTDFHRNPQYQTSWKSSGGSRDVACVRACVRACWPAAIMKLTAASYDCPNAPKNEYSAGSWPSVCPPSSQPL